MAHALSKPIEADDDHEEETHTCEICRGEVDGSDYVGCCRDGDCPRRIDAMCSSCADWDDNASFWMCPHCFKLYEQKKVCEEAIEKLQEVLEELRGVCRDYGFIYKMQSCLLEAIAQANEVIAEWDA